MLAGCGGGASGPTGESEPPPAPARATTPAPPTTPALGQRAYFQALDAYCGATVDAVARLGRTEVDRKDPVGPVATFARRYRAAVERLGRRTPPAGLRQFHLLTLAQARESADRIDDGVRLGRQGDTDAATTALGELQGLLPRTPPAAVRRGAPRCA